MDKATPDASRPDITGDDHMAIDPNKSKAIRQVVQEHPGMTLAAVSPGVVVFALVWWLTSPWFAILLGIVAVAGGVYILTRQK